MLTKTEHFHRCPDNCYQHCPQQLYCHQVSFFSTSILVIRFTNICNRTLPPATIKTGYASAYLTLPPVTKTSFTVNTAYMTQTKTMTATFVKVTTVTPTGVMTACKQRGGHFGNGWQKDIIWSRTNLSYVYFLFHFCSWENYGYGMCIRMDMDMDMVMEILDSQVFYTFFFFLYSIYMFILFLIVKTIVCSFLKFANIATTKFELLQSAFAQTRAQKAWCIHHA